jgi:TrmH family RNA methyltransferase
MSLPEITSTSNPRVKSWLALSKRSVRDTSAAFLVEGRREVERLTLHADTVETIWCEEYAGAVGSPRATTVSSAVFDKISHRQHPDGIAVVARTPDLSLDTFVPAEPALVLVADGIEKPGNIGAILRTCDALGAAFLGSSLGTDLVNPNVVRSAQGSLFAMPTAAVDEKSAVAWCTANTEVVVTRPVDAAVVWDLDLTRPVSVVIGSEDAGVSDAWSSVGTGARIPTAGTADSLNASVTAAIVIAEARRQRSG